MSLQKDLTENDRIAFHIITYLNDNNRHYFNPYQIHRSLTDKSQFSDSPESAADESTVRLICSQLKEHKILSTENGVYTLSDYGKHLADADKWNGFVAKVLKEINDKRQLEKNKSELVEQQLLSIKETRKRSNIALVISLLALLITLFKFFLDYQDKL